MSSLQSSNAQAYAFQPEQQTLQNQIQSVENQVIQMKATLGQIQSVEDQLVQIKATLGRLGEKSKAELEMKDVQLSKVQGSPQNTKPARGPEWAAQFSYMIDNLTSKKPVESSAVKGFTRDICGIQIVNICRTFHQKKIVPDIPEMRNIENNQDLMELIPLGLCGNSGHEHIVEAAPYLFQTLLVVAVFEWTYAQHTAQELTFKPLFSALQSISDTYETSKFLRDMLESLLRSVIVEHQNTLSIVETFPARAKELALRFVKAIAPIFISKNEAGAREPILASTGLIQPHLSDFLAALEGVFLFGLKCGWQIRQINYCPRLVWPDQDPSWDKFISKDMFTAPKRKFRTFKPGFSIPGDIGFLQDPVIVGKVIDSPVENLYESAITPREPSISTASDTTSSFNFSSTPNVQHKPLTGQSKRKSSSQDADIEDGRPTKKLS